MAARKERRTYTLDPDLVRYVEAVKKERKAESASSALETILRESKRKREHQRLEQAINDYYSGLGEAEQQEEREWGAFGESQFPEQ